jgi:hypothetical protein
MTVYSDQRLRDGTEIIVVNPVSIASIMRGFFTPTSSSVQQAKPLHVPIEPVGRQFHWNRNRLRNY